MRLSVERYGAISRKLTYIAARERAEWNIARTGSKHAGSEQRQRTVECLHSEEGVLVGSVGVPGHEPFSGNSEELY